MGLDAIFNGAPANVPSPSGQAALGLDQSAGVLYYTSPQSNGWQKATTTSTAGTIDGVTVTGTPSAGQAIVATSASAAHWAAPPTTGFSGTIVTAQLTPSTGTQGSITVVNGVITAVVAAT